MREVAKGEEGSKNLGEETGTWEDASLTGAGI